MDAIQHAMSDGRDRQSTRRRLVRKAAYMAPVVFAIAAAPQAALGKSGPPPSPKPPKPPNPPKG